MANVWLSSKSTVIICDYDKSDTSNSRVNRQTSALASFSHVHVIYCNKSHQMSCQVDQAASACRKRPCLEHLNGGISVDLHSTTGLSILLDELRVQHISRSFHQL